MYLNHFVCIVLCCLLVGCDFAVHIPGDARSSKVVFSISKPADWHYGIDGFQSNRNGDRDIFSKSDFEHMRASIPALPFYQIDKYPEPTDKLNMSLRVAVDAVPASTAYESLVEALDDREDSYSGFDVIQGPTHINIAGIAGVHARHDFTGEHEGRVFTVRADLWILDKDGYRIVIETAYSPDDEKYRYEITKIIDSIVIN